MPEETRGKRLEICQVHKYYDNEVHALKGVSIDVEPGEFLVLVGPSGCGKSTMLRLLAGLEILDEGDIRLDNESIARVAPKHRDVAMVFQNYALYPTMRVYDNMAFPLKMRHWKKDAIRERVLSVAEQLGIAHLLKRRPAQLSGGQRQRVALGRAMVREPSLFLMDEPLSNLDAELRVQTRHEIVDLQHRLGITTVYVTHDQTEAMTMGTRIAVLKEGELQQYDSPATLYERPGNAFVARFIGSPPMNIFVVAMEEGNMVLGDFSLQPPHALYQALKQCETKRLAVGFRPEHIEIDANSNFRLRIHQIEHVGRETFVYCELPGEDELLILAVEGDLDCEIGEYLPLLPKWEMIHAFDADTGLRITEIDQIGIGDDKYKRIP